MQLTVGHYTAFIIEQKPYHTVSCKKPGIYEIKQFNQEKEWLKL